MPNFKHIVRLAYLDILQREPDPGGLEHYNGLMNTGVTENQVRKALANSAEFAQRFPGAPVPIPDPPPPIPPPTGTMEPLRIEGNRFATSKGPIHLQGMIICCDAIDTPEDEAIARGWPLIDKATLDLLAEHDQNWTHVRLGPFSHGEPNAVQAYKTVSHNDDGGVFDLSRWNDSFWAHLRDLIAHAQSRGVYVECDLIDFWGIDHEVTPWSAHRNINGVDAGSVAATHGGPQAIHDQWIRKVVREIGAFPNVLLIDGNESWKQSGTAWSEGVIAIAKDELARLGFSRPVGSNNEDLPANADYYTFHQKTAHAAMDKPVGVTEYQTRPVEAVLEEAARARDLGTSFHFWRGGLSWSDTLRCLAGLKAIVNGGAPPPVADSCPPLARWGSVLHVLHQNGRILDKPSPTQSDTLKAYPPLPGGSTAIFDSTPRWGQGRGQICNEEKGYGPCGGRNCEDPRGPSWNLVEAPGGVKHKVGGNPFQYQVGPMVPGFYRLRCSPRPDCQDALGKPVQVSPGAATEITWTV